VLKPVGGCDPEPVEGMLPLLPAGGAMPPIEVPLDGIEPYEDPEPVIPVGDE